MAGLCCELGAKLILPASVAFCISYLSVAVTRTSYKMKPGIGDSSRRLVSTMVEQRHGDRNSSEITSQATNRKFRKQTQNGKCLLKPQSPVSSNIVPDPPGTNMSQQLGTK